MSKTVLIACSSKKLPNKAPARDLYTSPLFRKSLEYSELLVPNHTFILSAKHGLLELEEEILPYEESLNTIGYGKRRDWAESVLGSLEKKINLDEEQITFLAGKKYREFLIPRIKHYEVPMKGLGIGEQLKWLNDRIEQ